MTDEDLKNIAWRASNDTAQGKGSSSDWTPLKEKAAKLVEWQRRLSKSDYFDSFCPDINPEARQYMKVDKNTPTFRQQYIAREILMGRYPWEGIKEWNEFMQFIAETFGPEHLQNDWAKKITQDCCRWVRADKLLPPSGKSVLVAANVKYNGGSFSSWFPGDWQQDLQVWAIRETAIPTCYYKVTHWRFVDSPYDNEDIF